MKQIYFLVLLLFFTACNSTNDTENSESFSEGINVIISGEISGAKNQSLVLEYVDASGAKEIAKTNVNEDNTFSFGFSIPEIGIYQLKLGLTDGKVIPLTLVPNDKVSIKVDFKNFESLPVFSGTKWSSSLTKYMAIFNDFAKQQMMLMNNKEISQDDQIIQFLKIRKPLDDFANAEMKKDPSNPANIVLSTSLTPAMGFKYWDETFLKTLKLVAKEFDVKYKNAAISNFMKQQVLDIEAGFYDYKLEKSGQKPAPEIALKNPEGKEIKLSSLKGQVVLIDFWASWCGPCRKENPNVVKLYNKYKNKGFTVYSVSLDKDPNAWKQAIALDGLIWPNHVSDLKQWETPLTQIYKFNSIPFTVLIDRKGNIIETNLRGESLEQKLIEIL